VWANGGNITFDGDDSGMGSALISGNANLEVGGAINEQVKFDDGSTGTLTTASTTPKMPPAPAAP